MRVGKNVSPTNRWTVVGALIAAAICAAAPADAQPKRSPPAEGDVVVLNDPDKPWSAGVPMERREAAKAQFEEGNRLFRIPLFAKAADKYKAALADWKHPAFYFNLALAQLNLSQDVEARDSLERALAHGAAGLKAEEHREAQRQLEELARTLGRIRVICRTPGAEVTLDGVMLFRGPDSHESWVKATDHELTAKKTGYIAEARRLTVSPGELQELELTLITLSEATDRSRRWATWKPWAVVAVGATVAAAGGGLHALSARNFNAYDEGFVGLDCATPSETRPTPGCEGSQVPAHLRDQLTSARSQQAIAVGAYVAGGSLIAAGAILLYMNRPRLTEQGAAGMSQQSMAVMPAIGPDSIGVLMRLGL